MVKITAKVELELIPAFSKLIWGRASNNCLAGRLFMFAISIANYEPAVAREQRSGCPVLDTFDMLSPQYDQPQTQHDIEQVLGRSAASCVSVGDVDYW
jgi:hypothetical protein